jgi:DNA-binding winged helix-turn-helix (wHTH) protein
LAAPPVCHNGRVQRARYYAFDPFLLDVVDERLWKESAWVPLGHKAFAVLARLVGRPNQLVTKDDLLGSVWPDTAVGDAVLTTAMREIRSAVGDAARTPRYVETVHGRGYRFIAAVTEGSERPRPPSSREGQRPIVGREAECARLREWYDGVRGQQRRIALIAGEAGIGKTALVDTFLAGLADQGQVWIGRGHCIDQYGAGEAYMPILEALARLCRDSAGPVAAALREHAPSWHAHLPLAGPATPEQPAPVRPERMLRELAESLEASTASEPLVLVLEDLHWSDRSTLDWLAYLARRRDPARLMVLGTYRPVDALPNQSALRAVLPELRHQAPTAELVLDYLSRAAVGSYLKQRCADLPDAEGLLDLLHRRTGGHPLFLASIVDELQREGHVDAAARGVPHNVRQFIEHRLGMLSVEERTILEAAGVAGDPFAIASVAAATALPQEGIEARCFSWSEHQQLLVADGTTRWPDGTLSARYRFRHALFHETVYARIPTERRARLHHLIGNRLEAAHGRDTTAPIAAELAMHFERGHEAEKAVEYLERAARNAVLRSAYHEAEGHLGRAQAAMRDLPDGRERLRHEATQALLTAQLMEARQGWGVADVAREYTRARELCVLLRDKPRLLRATWGLITASIVRAELRKTQELSNELLTLAKKQRNRLFRMAAHFELGGTALMFGRTHSSRRHFCLAEAIYGAGQQGPAGVAAFGVDLGVFAQIWATHLTWQTGYPDRAHARAAEIVTAARRLAHPFTQTIVLAYAAMLEQFRHDVAEVSRLADETIANATEQGFPYYRAWAEVLRGWCRAAQGAGEGAVAEMRDAIERLQATAGLRLPFYRALLAEACGEIERIDEGLDVIEQAFADLRRSEERWWEAELHRTKGELLRRFSGRARLRAETCFRAAMRVAREQGAKSLELRAAVGFARLQRGRSGEREARLLLRRLCGAFTEGFDTPDLRDARALLAPGEQRARGAG